MNFIWFLLISAPLLAAYGWIMYTRGVYIGVDIGTTLTSEFFSEYMETDTFEKLIIKKVEEIKKNAHV